METLELINLLSSFASLLISIIAIIFSIVFYRWSNRSNSELQSATIKIESNTNKLEKIFDKLYSDTFGIMKSNIEVMQQHIFSNNSSGDSDLTKVEQTEELILSFLAKTKQSNIETIKYVIQNSANHTNRTETQIEEALMNLSKNRKVNDQNGLISISRSITKTADQDE